MVLNSYHFLVLMSRSIVVNVRLDYVLSFRKIFVFFVLIAFHITDVRSKLQRGAYVVLLPHQVFTKLFFTW